MNRKARSCLVACLSVGMLTVSASAQVRNDSFNLVLDPSNGLVQGGGTGWEDGQGDQWFEYPQDQDPSWWNTWFYDHPPDPTRWKEIDYVITVAPDPAFEGLTHYVEIAFNWSTLDFPATGEDGPPPLPGEEIYIGREIIAELEFTQEVSLTPVIPPHVLPLEFNPEWLSVDIRVDPDFLLNPSPVSITGDVLHDCVPEPATMALLGVGAMAVLTRRKRK